MLAKRNPNHDACNRQLTAAAAAGRQQHSALSCCWQLLLLTFTTTGGKKLVDTMPAPLITGFLASTCNNPCHATLTETSGQLGNALETNKRDLVCYRLGSCWSEGKCFLETKTASVWSLSLSECALLEFQLQFRKLISAIPSLRCANLVSSKFKLRSILVIPWVFPASAIEC